MKKIPLNEPEVIGFLKKYIETNGIFNFRKNEIHRIFIHGHSTLLNNSELEPFHKIAIKNRYPDILIQLNNKTIIAIEAKGNTNFDKGLSQAIQYKIAVDYSYLAGDYASLLKMESLINVAKNLGIGLIGVKDNQNHDIIEFFKPSYNLIDPIEYRKLRRILKFKDRFESEKITFNLNMPRNYLIIPILIERLNSKSLLSNYLNILNELILINFFQFHPNNPKYKNPLTYEDLERKAKKNLRKMINGSISLGLIKMKGVGQLISDKNYFINTEFGALCVKYFGKENNLEELKLRQSQQKIYQIDQNAKKAMTFFSMILFNLDITKNIINALQLLKNKGISKPNIKDLIIECIDIDWNLVLDFLLSNSFYNMFLKQFSKNEEKIKDAKTTNLDEHKMKFLKNFLQSKSLTEQNINSSFRYQFKAMLMHAGIIKGKLVTKDYAPEKDKWCLIL